MFRHHLCSIALKMASVGICLLIHGMLLASDLAADCSPPNGEYSESIIEKMKAAYAQVGDYQTETDVRVYRDGQIAETERFLYTFKKPNHIRIDLEVPDNGTILVYPDVDGKVDVRPGGLTGFLRLHLSPGSALLRNLSGQRIDQTDLGLLIQNIARSLTNKRRGELNVSKQNGRVRIEVLAEDHFLTGVLTLYHFVIDKTRWLPVEVQEFTPDGIIKREVTFRHLRTSIGIPDSYFQIDGEKLKRVQPRR